MSLSQTLNRLPFQPGVSEVVVEWKQDDGVQTVYAAPVVSLGGPSPPLSSSSSPGKRWHPSGRERKASETRTMQARMMEWAG